MEKERKQEVRFKLSKKKHKKLKDEADELEIPLASLVKVKINYKLSVNKK